MSILIFSILSMIVILALFRSKRIVKLFLEPLALAIFLFLISYTWGLTDEPIGMGLRGGRKALDSYTPESSSYVHCFSLLIGIITLILGIYFLFAFLGNCAKHKFFKQEKTNAKREHKKDGGLHHG